MQGDRLIRTAALALALVAFILAILALVWEGLVWPWAITWSGALLLLFATEEQFSAR